ncbi:putative nucleotidyltransferase, ribonuclease H [Tanacetum coccineum]|uniref:Nucleotidyltransferase, ribonuclease H n=1 Tax=Tanacetum coccineum TaxID=301880 RepID=A0ABQ4WDL1_9ASTR
MPPRKNRTLNEIHKQELEDRVMARMDERFDQFVDQLSDRIYQLMNRRGNRNVRGTYDEQSENQFGEDDDSSSDEQDTLSPKRFIDWLVAVEEVSEFKEVSENKRVSLIATNFVMYQRLQILKQGSKSVEDYTTEFYQLIARNDIQETKDQLVSRYIRGLRVQIMDFVNMFDPMTLSDAYQRALAFEKLNRRAKEGGGNTRPVSRASGSSGLKCFNCSEPGHRQSECKKAGKRHFFADPKGDDDAAYEEYEEAPVYDEEPKYEEEYVFGDVRVNLVVRRSCVTPKADGDDWLKHNIFQSTCTISGKVCTFVYDNLIVAEAVQKLGLKTENHPKPYKLQWLKKGSEVTISKRVHVPFFMGNTYKDNVWCDVVPMDACHLLLGRPWEYDRDVTHNGRTNTYSFLFRGVKITLMPNKHKEVVSKPTGTLLTLSQFEDELEIGDDVFVLIGKKVAEDSEIPEAMISLLEEFLDVFPDELPDRLPPLRDI